MKARRRRKKDWCRDPLPVGSIRIRNKNANSAVRLIKVRADGPKSLRWMAYARWWWVTHRGPVPPGLRVCHLDGDTLNDDPSNYGLLSPGDVVYLAHERNPAMSAANYAACRAATAAFNRETAAVRRVLTYLPTRWYPVDHARRLIGNQPRRQRWQVYRDCGLDASADNWRWCRSASLGWPGMPLICACVLHVLSERGPTRTRDLLQPVAELRRRNGWRPYEPLQAGLRTAAHWLRKRGWVESKRIGGGSLHAATSGAAHGRVACTPLVPIRGRDLSGPAYAGYRRVSLEELLRR